MRKQMLTFCLLAISFITLQAAVHTVSNRPGSTADFTNLWDAKNTASAGDTLLIEGTNIPYYLGYNDYFDKSLTVIGIGFNSDKDILKRTIIRNNDSRSNFQISSGAAGSKFYGIYFSGGVWTYNTASNLLFEDCYFEGGISINNAGSNNLVARNCIFSNNNGHCVDLPSSAIVTSLFENCLFDGFVHGRSNNLLEVTFNHCLFLRTDGASLIDFANSLTVNNSIFMNETTIASASTYGGSFSNNIVYGAATMPPAGNGGSGNIVSTDPLLVNYTPGSWFAWDHDYDVQAGSPAENAGTDGTDIGIHGGTTFFSEKGEALIVPIVRSMSINNTSVVPGGTLEVQVVASKPNID